MAKWGHLCDGLGWYVAAWIVSLEFLDGRQDSKKYCETLEHAVLPFAAEVYREMATWVFQQDGASIHRSAFTCSWLTERGVRTIDGPAKSPDLNIKE